MIPSRSDVNKYFITLISLRDFKLGELGLALS